MFQGKQIHRKNVWRMFAWVMIFALVFQSASVSSFAAGDLPQEGSTAIEETLPQEGQTTPGTGDTTEPSGDEGQTSPVTGDTTQPTDPSGGEGQTSPATGDTTQPSGGEGEAPAQDPQTPQESVVPESPEESPEVIISEEVITETQEALNNGTEDVIPAGTAITFQISGAGLFTDAALEHAGYSTEGWFPTFTYQTETEMIFEELFGVSGEGSDPGTMSEILSDYMIPFGNLSYFGHWYGDDSNVITSLQDLQNTQVVHAMFFNYDYRVFLSPSGTSATTRRIRSDGGAKVFSIDVKRSRWDPDLYQTIYDVPVTGVTFGNWFVEDPDNAPFTITTDPQNPLSVTVTPKENATGTGILSVYMLPTEGSDDRFRYSYRIVVEDDNTPADILPAGTGFHITLIGNGSFTDEIMESEGYDTSTGFERYLYIAKNDISYEDLMLELSGFVVPGDPYTEVNWYTNDHEPVTNVDMFIPTGGLYGDVWAYCEEQYFSVIPQGTKIRFGLADGYGKFTEKAKKAIDNNPDYPNTFVYTVPKDMSLEELLGRQEWDQTGAYAYRISDALSPYFATVGNLTFFSGWKNDNYYDVYSIRDILNAGCIRVASECREYRLNITPVGTAQNVTRIKNNSDPVTLTPSAKMLNNIDGIFSKPVTGITFGKWFTEEEQDVLPFTYSTGTNGKLTITPKKDMTGETMIYLPLLADGEEEPFDHAGYRIIIEDENTQAVFPEGDTITLRISGAGAFTETAKSHSGYNAEEKTYSYTPEKDLSLDELEERLEPLVEPRGNLGVYNGLYGPDGLTDGPLTHPDQLRDMSVVTAVFTSRPVDLELTVPEGKEHVISGGDWDSSLRLRENEGPVDVAFRFYLTETGETVTGVKIWRYGVDERIENGGVITVTPSPAQTGYSGPVAQLDLYLVPEDDTGTFPGFIFYGRMINVYSEPAYTALTYEAYTEDGEWLQFHPNNPSSLYRTDESLVLQDPYLQGYAFDGWYREYHPSTHAFSQPLENNTYNYDADVTEVTLYAKFKRIVPVTSLSFVELPMAMDLADNNTFPLPGSVEILPENHTDSISFESSNPAVISVVDDPEYPGEKMLQAKGVGTAVITAYSGLNPNVRTSATVKVVEQVRVPHTVQLEVYTGGKWVALEEIDYVIELTDNGKQQQVKLRAVVKDEDEENASIQDVEWGFVYFDTNNDLAFTTDPVAEVIDNDEWITLEQQPVPGTLSQDGTLTIRPYHRTFVLSIAARPLGMDTDPLDSDIAEIIVSKKYKVSFVNAKRTAPKAVMMAEGSLMAQESLPLADQKLLSPAEVTGYTFDGWYGTVNGVETKFVWDKSCTMPAQDLVLTAKWTPVEKTFTAHYGFDSFENDSNVKNNYDSVATKNSYPTTFTYTVESSVTLPKVEIEGYDFLGWYSDKACTKKITAAIAGSKWSHTDVYCLLKRAVESVTFDKTAEEVRVFTVGEPNEVLTLDVKPVIAPPPPSDPSEPLDPGHDYILTYTSSNKAIARVDEVTGVVTPLKAGTALITASCGGKSDYFTVKVIAKNASEKVPATVIINKPKAMKAVYDADKDKKATIQFTATVKDENGASATVQDVEWEVKQAIDGVAELQPTDFATVNSSGKVTLDLTDVGPDGAELRVYAVSKADKGIKSEAVTIKVERYYTLTFETSQGKAPAAQRLKPSDKAKSVVQPVPKVKGSYILMGWYVKGDDTKTHVILDEANDEGFVMPGSPVTLVADWEPLKISYTFRFGLDTEKGYPQDIIVAEVPYGDRVGNYLPDVPDTVSAQPLTAGYEFHGRDGSHYRFLGWYTDTAKTKALNINSAVSSTTDVTLYAKTERVYEVSFNLGANPGDVVNYPEGVSVQYKKKGEKVSQPAEPVRVGYRFTGWYATGEAAEEASASPGGNIKTKINFTKALGTMTGDITYHAGWYKDDTTNQLSYVVNEYTNRYDTFAVSVTNAEEFEAADCDYNAELTAPQEPQAMGYTFDGWYTDKARTIPFTFPQRITKDTTIYARWRAEQHQVDIHTWSRDEETESYRVMQTNTLYVDHGTPVPVEELEIFRGIELLKECRVHDEGGGRTGETYNLQDSVTSDISLDLIYYGERHDNPDTYEGNPLYDMSVLTDAYEKLGEVPLPEDYEWAAPETPVSNYKGKGVTAMKIKYTGGARKATLTVPVRFYTIKGLIFRTYTTVMDAPINGNTRMGIYYLEPVLSGAGTDWKYTGAASLYLAQSGKLVAKSNLPENVSMKLEENISYDSFGQPVGARVNIWGYYETPVMSKKTMTVTCSYGEGKNALVASAKTTLLPVSDAIRYIVGPDYTFITIGDSKVPYDSQHPITLGLEEAKASRVVFQCYIRHEPASASKSITAISSNTAVMKTGTVKKTKQNDYESKIEVPLTILKGGTAYLTLSAGNEAKSSMTCAIEVTDPETRLVTTAVTLDKNRYGGRTVSLTPAYGDSVYNLSVDSVTPDSKTKAKVKVDAERMKHWFTLREMWSGYQQEDGTYQYEVGIDEYADIASIPEGSYTLTLKNHEVPVEGKLTVRVTHTVPKVTVKQSAPLNLKKTSDAAPIELNLIPAVGERVTAVNVIGSDGAFSPYVHDERFDGRWWFVDRPDIKYVGSVGVKKTDAPGVSVTTKSSRNITLEMWLEGYRTPLRQTVTLNVTDKQPVAKIASGAVTFCEGVNNTFLRSVLLDLTVDGVRVKDLRGWTITPDSALAEYYNFSTEEYRGYEYPDSPDDYIRIVAKNSTGNKTVNGKVTLTHPDYEVPLIAPLKVTIGKTTALKLSLTSSTVKLNRNTTEEEVSVGLYFSGMEGFIHQSQVEIVPPENLPEDGRRVPVVKCKSDYGSVTVSWSEGSETIPAGNYKYTIKVKTDSKTYSVPLTVQVVNTALNKTVTVTQKNLFTVKKPQVALALKVTDLHGTITGVRLGGADAHLFHVYGWDGTWYVDMHAMKEQYVPGHKYDVTIESVRVLSPGAGGKETEIELNKPLDMQYRK